MGEWLSGGPEEDVVISSRIRLARNVSEYPFISRASGREVARIEEVLHNKIMKADFGESVQYYRLDRLDPVYRELLVERHLIGLNHAEADWVRGVAFNEDERMSLLVNEEDHLRMQAIRGGLRLREACKRVFDVEAILAEMVPFAFSARYGYLTACPTNVGTGMRASVMLHLPALVMSREMDKVLQLSQEDGLIVRGLYGEGTQASADLYQISNQLSLGVTEEEVLQAVSVATEQVVELERESREDLAKRYQKRLSERIDRAYRLLKSASMISSEEALNLLSQVRMGIELGLVKQIDDETVRELVLLTLPAHLQTMVQGKETDRLERNELRASYLRERLIN